MDYIHYKVCDEIIDPFPNVNGYTIEVWEWISDFIPHFTWHVITYPCWERQDNTHIGFMGLLVWPNELTLHEGTINWYIIYHGISMTCDQH